MQNEAEQRKARSIAILKREQVPYIDHLPIIETAAEIEPWRAEEVALRAIALAVVAVKGETSDEELTRSVIKRFGAYPSFTAKERAFIDDPSPSEQDSIQFTWRYEGYAVMLWALGFTDTLGRPDTIVDAAVATAILQKFGRDGFLAKAALRPMSEILDEADLIYRYHWAVTEARIKGEEPPAGLDPGVVYERHYALNWLIRYEGQAWDDVSTDT